MTEQDPPEEEPKIVVDTDWKEQVAREKEQAEAAAPPDSEPAPDDGSETSSDQTVAEAGPSEAGGEEYPSPPPASFEVLVSMMFTQAMAMLGQMPDPSTGESKVNKTYAKHYIDTMEMLQIKTEGNLSDDEKKVLSEALHALRMMYVNVKG